MAKDIPGRLPGVDEDWRRDAGLEDLRVLELVLEEEERYHDVEFLMLGRVGAYVVVVGGGVELESGEDAFAIFHVDFLVALDPDLEEMERLHGTLGGLDYLQLALHVK